MASEVYKDKWGNWRDKATDKVIAFDQSGMTESAQKAAAQSRYDDYKARTGKASSPVMEEVPTMENQFSYDDILDQINELKKAQQQAAIAALDKARNSSLSNLSAEKEQIEPRYYNSRNNASTSSQLGKQSFAEYLAARGLTNSGAAAQGEINRQADLQGTLGNLQTAENQEYADNARRTTDVNNAYESDVAAAKANAEATALQNTIAAMQQAAQQAQQQKQFEANLALQAAGLTGQYNGMDTLANKQYQWSINPENPSNVSTTLNNQLLQKQIDAYQNPQTQQNWNNAFNLWQTLGTATPEIANILGVPTGAKTADYSTAMQQLALSAAKANSSSNTPSVTERNYQNKQNAQAATSQAMDYLNRWASGQAYDDNGNNLGRADAADILNWIGKNAGELNRQGVDVNALTTWAKNRFTWYR